MQTPIPREIRNSIAQIVRYIEGTACNYTQKEKANLMDKIRVESADYQLLKQFINQEE